MRKLLSLALALCMVFTLAACGEPAATESEAPEIDPKEAAEAVIASLTVPEGIDPAAVQGVEDGVLTVAMECAYAPYNWTQVDDSNGGVAISNMSSNSYANGYDVMISQIICDIYGWELEVVSSAWDSLVPGVQSGTIWYDSCLPQIPDVDLIAPAETAPSMIMALTTGQVDYICTDVPTATAAAQKDDSLVILNFAGTEGDFQFATEEERAENVNIGISVQKGNTTLLEAMDAVLSQMDADDFNAIMAYAISVQPEI